MTGNSRFELSAASPEELTFKGSCLNGQRCNSMNGILDRSTSFCEGNEGHMFFSGATMSRANSTSTRDVAPLAQYLLLDPITMGDQKYTRSGELRRMLGIPFGSTIEDCTFGTGNMKPPPPVATEELKRFKASLQEASVKARYRSKRLDEYLHKLNKYSENLNSKKQLKNEMMPLPNERLGGSHFLKMGSQTHRNPSELVNQRLEERPKNIILNKRIRKSVADTRVEGQSNNFVRQPLVVGKDRDNIRDGGKGCDIAEGKIRRLPAGGETWDIKMKRKRSMGTVFARSINGDGELKRVMHLKLADDSGLQSSDAQSSRSGSTGSNSKVDVASRPASASSSACVIAKNEQEKVSRNSLDGSNKERVVLKVNKFNVRDNNSIGGNYRLTKGKASRAPRTGPLMIGNSSSASHSSEALQNWDQPSNLNKPHSVNGTNRKRPLPPGSSSSPMAQWVGQRPQKISRIRRVNVVSPVVNCDEVQMSTEGCCPSDIGTRTSAAARGPHHSKGAANNIQHGSGVKHENVSSPARLSESEDSGAGENGESKLKEKRLGSNEVDERAINNSYSISSSILAKKKNKIADKEDIRDGPRRQGRSSRGSSVLKTSVSSSMKEKLEVTTLTKQIRSMKPASEKNGSKSGRPPLKKSGDRKGITHLGHPSSVNSPDIAGESDGDREELLAAANFASNASFIGCSSSFWKKLEPIFAPVSLEDMSYLKELVKSTGEDQRCLSQVLCLESDGLDGLAHKENLLSQSPLSGEIERSILNQTDSKEIPSMVDIIDQNLDVSLLCRQMYSEEKTVAPLYQRVLTALIIDDQTDEVTTGDGIVSLICESDDYPAVTSFSQDVDHPSRIRSEYESRSDLVSCNGNAPFTTATDIHDQELDDVLQVHQGPFHPETEMLPMLSENGIGELQATQRISHSSSFNCHFEQMSVEDKLLLELQSVGLYPEPVPDLADEDKEAINQEIIQLQKGLHQQVTKKKEYFLKLIQAVEEGREVEQRALEQVAMDKLVELAYKKKLATRGSSAARIGLPKVSKQVASAFMKRTLARCRQFEETGRGCFLEPVLKYVLFAAPSRENYASLVVNPPQTQNSQKDAFSGLFPGREQDVYENLNLPPDQDFARTGPILNRGKRKELLLDDVGASASFRSASTLTNSFMGGAKGKRSERERDKYTSGRNSVTKAGRHLRGERKTKAKPKQKMAQLSTSGNGSLIKLMENTNSEHQLASGCNEVISSGGNLKSKVGAVRQGYNTKDLSIETKEPMDLTNLHDLDAIGLDVGTELNGHQDLASWFFDEDVLQDHDEEGPLDIPMDDLNGLKILL